MDDFDVTLQLVIEERVSVLFQIERTIFTNRYSLSSKDKEIFSIQSISMIYSIWEGFIQTSFNLYIDEINKLNIDFVDFCDEILIHHMENSFKQFKQYPDKDSKKVKFFRDLQVFQVNGTPQISRIVDTESNVSFNVLNKLLKTFSLELFTEYWGDYKYPAPNLKESMDLLLKLRNTVAHGGDLMPEHRIDQEKYVRFKILITDLMYEVRIRMLDGLNQKTFTTKL